MPTLAKVFGVVFLMTAFTSKLYGICDAERTALDRCLASGVECRLNSDCHAGQECRNGQCVSAPRCSDLPARKECSEYRGEFSEIRKGCAGQPQTYCGLYKWQERKCRTFDGCGNFTGEYTEQSNAVLEGFCQPCYLFP